MTAGRRLILHTEASLGFGGQELRIVAEARWLLDHGWDALVAGQPDSRLLQETARQGVPAVALRMRSALDLAALAALRHLIAERDVALVHTHSSVDSWLGGLAARSRRRPVVRSRHVTIAIPRRRGLVYRLAHRVITSGEAAAAIVAAAGVPRARIVAIPPGVDTARFHAGVSGAGVRAELTLAAAPVVGLVANIRGSKGHNVVLEAARRVLAARPAARFLIVGDGIGFDDVRRRVSALGLDAVVSMTGFRRDIPEVMAALDVLVLPSIRSEAASQVIPQALAVGTPVVATDVGGSRELIRDGDTGRLVAAGDPAALAGAILDVLGDRERARAMARRGQALVRERHSLDAVMRRTTAVYEALLGG
ncbi:MAG TPA: glycosyltransferase [Methylomirabilota bacterium]|nr:glycosyltransferase [Methylomirabilota bacterium]